MYTAERCERAYAEVRTLASAARRVLMPDFAFGAYVYVSYGSDHAAAVRRGDEHLAWRYREPRYRTDLSGKYVVAGDADACVEQLLAFRAAGCTHLVLSLVRDEREAPEPELEAFAGEVLPRLRAAVTAT